MNIHTINQEELLFLRERILEKYRPAHERVHVEPFTPKAYKPAYDTLLREIGRQLTHNGTGNGQHGHVSAGLLRKLFYDSRHKEEESFSTVFLNALYLYITDGKYDRLAYKQAHSPEAVEQQAVDWVHICAYAGALAGCVTAFTTATLLLYNGLSHDHHAYLMPFIFLVQVVLGWLAGRALGKMVVTYRDQPHLLPRFRIFTLYFFVFLLMRQLAVRDALIRPGTGKGGPLGEPDFESLATAGACAAGLLVIAHFLLREERLTLRKSLILATNTALLSGLIFGGVYFVFRVLVLNGVLTESDYLIAPYVFQFEFPHPQRIFLVVVLAWAFPFVFINYVNWRLRPE